MSGGAVGDSGGTRKERQQKRKPKRMSIHIDMTPLVDIAFLLLTFFIKNNRFPETANPEINLPPDKTSKKMAELTCSHQV